MQINLRFNRPVSLQIGDEIQTLDGELSATMTSKYFWRDGDIVSKPCIVFENKVTITLTTWFERVEPFITYTSVKYGD